MAGCEKSGEDCICVRYGCGIAVFWRFVVKVVVRVGFGGIDMRKHYQQLKNLKKVPKIKHKIYAIS